MESKTLRIKGYLLLIALMSSHFVVPLVHGKENFINAKITIDGVEKELIQTIQENLFINDLTCDEAEWRVRHAAKKIDVELGESLNAFGYYNGSFSKKVEKKENCWQVFLEIDPGPQTKVETIDVTVEGEASEDEEFQNKLGLLPIKEGDYLRHDKYEKIKELIETTAHTRGYFDGKYLEHTLRINKAKNLAAISIQYDSGSRYRFGDTRYEQNYITEELLTKYISAKQGEYYHNKKITKTYQDLNSSGYFADVEVKALIDERHDGIVPIEIKLLEAKRKTYSVGAGASTNTGPRFILEHKNKRVNSRGHTHKTLLLLSPVKSNLSFGYQIPIGQPQTDYVGLQLGVAHEDTDTSESDSILANIGRTKLRTNGWLESIFLELLQENFKVGDEDETSALLMPGISWTKIRQNNPIYPTKGYYLSMETRVATQALLSDVDLLRLKFNSKGILPLGSKARFLTRLEAGYNVVDNFEELPATLRFFAGGDNSIRGYEFQSLGPENSSGEVIGGEGLLVSSLELDYLFKPKWAVAAFVDAGDAFDTNDIQIKTSAGIGGRWLSPIGPIKVDIAFPINDNDVDNFRFHFRLGPEL